MCAVQLIQHPVWLCQSRRRQLQTETNSTRMWREAVSRSSTPQTSPRCPWRTSLFQCPFNHCRFFSFFSMPCPSVVPLHVDQVCLSALYQPLEISEQARGKWIHLIGSYLESTFLSPSLTRTDWTSLTHAHGHLDPAVFNICFNYWPIMLAARREKKIGDNDIFRLICRNNSCGESKGLSWGTCDFLQSGSQNPNFRRVALFHIEDLSRIFFVSLQRHSLFFFLLPLV